MYEYKNITELITLAERHHIPISEVVVRQEMEEREVTMEEVLQEMDRHLVVFRASIDEGLADSHKSVSQLTGGDAKKLVEAPHFIFSEVPRRALVYALAVSEGNAKMHKIVACPTAGSCGIGPGTIYAVGEEIKALPEQYGAAFFTAAGIGAVIARNASVAGAVGGCQAECGTAAAMSAGAVTEMLGGTPRQVGQAMALALKNVLGLVCDPVAGLVEVPCVKRNGFYAIHALTAAEMALAGIESVIPPDEIISAMNEIGRTMPQALRETSEGGLAKTETGRAIQKRLADEVENN